jgi:hypothetical protein
MKFKWCLTINKSKSFIMFDTREDEGYERGNIS